MGTYALSTLHDRGVEVMTKAIVTRVTEEHIEIKSNKPGQVHQGPLQEPSILHIPYGSLIWAGGIATRPVTKEIIKFLGSDQSSTKGLLVDHKLRVKGAKNNSIWALGDCAVSGLAPTAQVATQQGMYLGQLFRDTKMDKHAIDKYADFVFQYRGSLAYLGGRKGVAEVRKLWDDHPNDPGLVVKGGSAFIIW
eukprot:CAMPEP_0119040750 /NCGR_PEP_ID=MMETSP1177-20130426/10746_1 /TAXON_ID=2985 /ORGANISM="Ochromonas sp, Strain CCMP1899" /LENGTH=192 /DNA_ID=CAMNT_0007006073 /DNA_START=893 /DNA_END=1468 /DNA_ORIENTATION=-